MVQTESNDGVFRIMVKLEIKKEDIGDNKYASFGGNLVCNGRAYNKLEAALACIEGLDCMIAKIEGYKKEVAGL